MKFTLDDVLKAHDCGIIDLDKDDPELVLKKLAINEQTYYMKFNETYPMLHKALKSDFELKDAAGSYYTIKSYTTSTSPNAKDQDFWFKQPGGTAQLISTDLAGKMYVCTSLLDEGIHFPYNCEAVFLTAEDAEVIAAAYRRMAASAEIVVEAVTVLPGKYGIIDWAITTLKKPVKQVPIRLLVRQHD